MGVTFLKNSFCGGGVDISWNYTYVHMKKKKKNDLDALFVYKKIGIY